MKRIFIGICLLMVGAITSCNTWIDPDTNSNPTSPQEASFDVVLPTIQAGMGYVMGGDLGRFSSVLTQHNRGIERQHLGIYNYVFTESDVDNAWQFNLYSGPMNDMSILMDRARANGSVHYLGVAQVMMAHAIGTVTDLWGDVPYSDAFRGSSKIQPVYDTQENIYQTIQTLLDEAIVNLSAPSSTLSPGSDDFMYGGDLSLWIKAAWAIKARYALHLSKRNGNSAALEALASLGNAMSSNADDMQFTFGTVETEANPWYQFVVQRDGDLVFGDKLSEIMNATNDPRRPFYAEQDDSGTFTSRSRMGPFYASINSPVPFITFTECKFIEAEALFRTGNPSEAYRAYREAVRSSLDRTGVSSADADAFLAQASVDPGVANLTLNDIMTQKYVAMYTQSESFTDWRRTELPALTPTVTGKEIPRRFPYPQSERLYNDANMPDGLTINSRVWWDVP